MLEGKGEHESVPSCFQWILGKWRCPASWYGSLVPWVREQDIRDQVPRWQHLDYTLQENRVPHDYQQEAMAAWEEAGKRGSVVLPTGAGKSLVAVQLIQRVNRSAVVVAPTIDLLHMWYAILCHAFGTEVGVYYGGEKQVLPLTVTTYHSLGDLVANHGNAFALICFDEAHHLPAPVFGEGALMTPAPMRLGLTATYPTEEEQRGGRWRLEDLIGPVVYMKRIEDLVGAQLAHYRTQRLRVNLTPEEQQTYNEDHGQYLGFVRARRLIQQYQAGWLAALVRLSATDAEARAALLARQRLIRLLSSCEGKLQAVDALLQEHATERVLIFTEHNAAVYALARRHLLPALTHETPAAERKAILDGFREGRYRAIATSRVLNEGIDVPEAKVAVILGGTAGAREYIQRLGRVLRKVENRQAVLYEVLVRGTIEEGKVQRRRAASRAANQAQERAYADG